MKALYYEQFNGPIELVEVKDPTPTSGGVVIKVEATGLCLSDWHGWKGHDPDIFLPHVPGHELAGIIVETGKNIQDFSIGDRVTLPFVGGCGNCEYCKSGNHQVCNNQFQSGFTHWGSFAEYVAIDFADTNLVILPSEIDFAAAASLGCRFATAFRAVVDQGRLQPDQWLTVFGCGGVGLSAIMIGKALGARVIAIDIQQNALEKASAMGADYTFIKDDSKSTVDKIRDITKGGSQVTMDAIGHPEVVFDAINSLRKRGKHIQVGLIEPSLKNTVVPMDKVIAHELEIIGSHGMQSYRYAEMMDMIINGKLSPKKLISELITLSQAKLELPILDHSKEAGIKVITSFI
jgi:alcohol dehydrogenase